MQTVRALIAAMFHHHAKQTDLEEAWAREDAEYTADEHLLSCLGELGGDDSEIKERTT